MCCFVILWEEKSLRTHWQPYINIAANNHPETPAITWHCGGELCTQIWTKIFFIVILWSLWILRHSIISLKTFATIYQLRWPLHGKHHSIFPQKIKSRLAYYDLGHANLEFYAVHELGHGLNARARALLVRIGRCFTIGCLNGFPYQQHVEENSPEKRGDERGGLTGLDHTALCSLS